MNLKYPHILKILSRFEYLIKETRQVFIVLFYSDIVHRSEIFVLRVQIEHFLRLTGQVSSKLLSF